MSYGITVSRRKRFPRWIRVVTPIFTIGAALGVGIIPLVVSGIDPIQAYAIMIFEPITTVSGLSQMLVKAVPLTLAALGIYLPMRAGLWNIGAEGQIYLGGIIGTWVALNLNAPGFTLLVIVLMGGAIGGGLWGFIPGWLRAKWDVNEIIVTLMMTFVAINVTDHLVRGPMQASGRAGYPASASLPEAARLPKILGVGIPVGIFLALLMAVAIYLLINWTQFGYEAKVLGSNPNAADMTAISHYTVFIVTMAVGGALAGLGGIAEIAGSQHRLIANFSPGYGFTAIAIALLGRSNAMYVFAAGIFFSLLFVGTSRMSVQLGASAAIVEILQALVILFLITAEFFRRYSISIDRSRILQLGVE